MGTEDTGALSSDNELVALDYYGYDDESGILSKEGFQKLLQSSYKHVKVDEATGNVKGKVLEYIPGIIDASIGDGWGQVVSQAISEAISYLLKQLLKNTTG